MTRTVSPSTRLMCNAAADRLTRSGPSSPAARACRSPGGRPCDDAFSDAPLMSVYPAGSKSSIGLPSGFRGLRISSHSAGTGMSLARWPRIACRRGYQRLAAPAAPVRLDHRLCRPHFGRLTVRNASRRDQSASAYDVSYRARRPRRRYALWLPPRAAAAAGFFFEAFVAPPASCSSRSAAPSRTLAICLFSVSRSIQPSAFA